MMKLLTTHAGGHLGNDPEKMLPTGAEPTPTEEEQRKTIQKLKEAADENGVLLPTHLNGIIDRDVAPDDANSEALFPIQFQKPRITNT